ncbi:Unknown (Maco41) [Spodoptera exigua multiple nucleopolyhedrovirus]|nr:Unknown (Maco41) [Spodoptera exigua multiple nucleopolyhedrovirus]CDG72937.1 Unknown (Maco41) [Spodoptera exigua multiple nucleopolyhedrovirus]CDG73074.1 Unknown (Maco41) [Spodoptera exigua multiple nucleopolyhedrovirus]CDG73212.1 Unknown (Maco41) [Spodoptera exigua multiple nucleopolyhedrovirus]
MQIALYTLALTSVGEHDNDVVEKLLEDYFCPIFMLHSDIDTLALCEDRVMCSDNTVTMFQNYEDFLMCEQSNDFVATIQQVGDTTQKLAMIEKIITVFNENGNGPIVLSDYY